MSTAELVVNVSRATTALDDGVVEAFAATFRGDLIGPADPGYDGAPLVWNGMIDKYPALIAQCTGTADVAAAVRFGREHDLAVAVRGRGHNVAGNALNDGGLVIDLSQMRGVHVDPVKRTVRAQPGANWGDVDRETQLFGLVTPGGEVSTTGIAGFTLSGGMGMLRRKWGLACDNLLAVEIVTAAGEIIQASQTSHPDLFWAVRGGGGNFGIVTWFKYQLYPLGPEVASAIVLYPLADAPAIMRAWREFTREAPVEITSEVIFNSLPPFPDLPAEMHGAPTVFVGAVYAGPADEGERALRPLREFATPIIDLSGRPTYVQSQSAFDASFPDGRRNYWKSLFVDELADELLEATIALGAERPTADTIIVLRHLGGAMSQVPDDATAYANRRALFNLSIDGTWEDPRDDERVIAWTREAWRAMREPSNAGVYLNFAGLGEENELLARAGFGPNYERLRQIKRRYDPDNLFRGNINIKP